MAIPFYIPSDEETVNNYRSMDDLLWQLCDVLRQILLHRAPPVQVVQERNDAARTPPHHPEQRLDAVPDVLVDLPRLPLPDLVQDVAVNAASTSPRRPQRRHETTPVAPPRRRRRRRCGGKDADVHHVTTPSTTSYRLEPPLSEGLRKIEVRDNWTQVGEDLRKIADEFHASLQDFDQQKPQESPPTNKVSLVSLLVPNGHLWMAVIVLLGWGAIQRTR